MGPTINIANYPFLADGGAVSAVKTENGVQIRPQFCLLGQD